MTPPSWAISLFPGGLTPALTRADGSVAVWQVADAHTTATISEQFTVNAGDYHARYAAAAHFEALFSQALAATKIDTPPAPLILDLGTGSGVNSAVPCLKLFPGARIVASDLSAELLAILADHVRHQGLSEQVICVVMDAMGDYVAPGSFDLVTGSAILHHLTRPPEALASAARALKSTGHAIFMEPFDGYGLLRLAYERILAEAALRADPLPAPVEETLRAMVADITARTNPDIESEAFAAMDDKWLFSRHRVEVMAGKSGFGQARVVAHNDHPSLYRDATQVQLRLSGGEAAFLPAWALAILDSFDSAITMPAKRQLLLEGTIVLSLARA